MSQIEDFKYFQSKLFELLKEHDRQFVIVKDKEFHGFYASLEDAHKEALEKFGLNGGYIIQEITDIIPTHYISMNIPNR